jgi:glycerol-3-phosphate dehydrogenase (NAD(P)+)
MSIAIGVIGGGSFGTALAKLLGEKGHDINLWVFEPDLCDRMKNSHVNDLYLPEVTLPPNVFVTNSLKEAIDGRKLLISVTPSHVVRGVMSQVGPLLPRPIPVVSATKGIETDTLLLMSEVLEEVLPKGYRDHLAYISGPSFAKEISKGLPTAVSVASYNPNLARWVQEVFSSTIFRCYTNFDVVGIELGGALKNVIAVTVGIGDGMGLGQSARAALITRGLAEITRLAAKKGADPLTFLGLAGVGDLVLTCCGDLSRNRSVGLALGRGKTLREILAEMKMVAEGVKTTKAAYDMARKYGVEAPIIEQTYAILYEDKPARDAVRDVMARALKSEVEAERT